ncbi:MAG: cupin domain-containing protein [Pseudomonadota bacterium]
MPALIHGPEGGEANRAFNLRRWFRVTPGDTDGAFAVFEEEIPEGSGPPLHIHHTEHELFTVLSGRVLFHADGEETAGDPGYTILIPPGIPHAFKGLGPGPSRVLVMLSPGRGEGLFREVEAEGLQPGRDTARIEEIGARYDVEFVGPPL